MRSKTFTLIFIMLFSLTSPFWSDDLGDFKENVEKEEIKNHEEGIALSMDFYIKGAFFIGLLNRKGISLGAKMISYPFKPISLEIRSGGLFFQSITFAEVEIKLGVQVKSFEIFGDFYTLQSEMARIYSFGIGEGYHL
ncbi:MAG: hypothetical protein PF518_08575 [Spirochaetaceae bacterium]|jgi:hypothetical protein|nr:hypothetical protein [Spirochaetaceae bacterium]